MYKNRVKNDKKNLKFPLFYFANEEIQRKTEWENTKYTCYFDFPALDFLVHKIHEWKFQKKKIVVLYPIFIHTLIAECHKCFKSILKFWTWIPNVTSSSASF